jgi:UDP-N-acetylmuramyl pentapeptide synthase
LRDDFKSSEDAFEVAFAAVKEIPAGRRLAVIGEIQEETGIEAYRTVGAQVTFFDHVLFVGTGKKLQAFRSGARAAGMDVSRIDRVANAPEALEALRGQVHANDVLFIKGRWQQALGRVGLGLAGRNVQCRADPCPFKRMLCDTCPFLEEPFDGLTVKES